MGKERYIYVMEYYSGIKQQYPVLWKETYRIPVQHKKLNKSVIDTQVLHDVTHVESENVHLIFEGKVVTRVQEM